VLGIALFILLVVLCVSGLFMWVRLAARNTRVIDAPDGKLEDLVVGGVMARHVITSGTLVRLELFDWGVRLRGTVIARWVVPTWEARYDELAIAELVALPQSRIAVCFRLRDNGGAIAFLSNRSQDILRQLARHGVPVSRAVTQIRRVEEMYS
jgi:hypothetical protein